jgi:hypothetical protein
MAESKASSDAPVSVIRRAMGQTQTKQLSAPQGTQTMDGNVEV